MYCSNYGKEIAGGNRLKKYLAGVLLALAVCILLFRLLSGGTVYLVTDYLSLEQRGINGSGEAGIVFDREAFLSVVSENRSLTEEEKEQIVSALEELEKNCALSETSGLSNGDEIRVTSNVDKKLLRSLGIKLKNGTKDMKVEGLAEKLNIMVNDYLQMSFYGFDGDGYSSVQIDWDGIYQVIAEQAQLIDPDTTGELLKERGIYSAVNSLSFQPFMLESLSNGDEVSVEVIMDQTEIPEYAITFSCESLTGTVGGLVEPETICISDYLSCVYEGYDGAGAARLRVDEEKLKSDLKTRYEETERGVYGTLTEDEDLDAGLDVLAAAVSGSFRSFFQIETASDGALKNGDEITVTCSLTDEENPAYLETFGLYLEAGTWKTIVSGLKEPKEIDLSEALILSVEGVCPQVQVIGAPNYDLDYLDDLNREDISFRRTVMLHNGETYTGTIGYDADALLRRGYKVSGNSYTVTVEGLNTYCLTLDSLEDERIRPVKDILMDEIRSELDRNNSDLIDELETETGWVQWHQLQSELTAARIVYASGEDYFRNRLYLVGKVTVPVKKPDRSIDQKECYVLQSFDNIEETPAGALVFDPANTGTGIYSGGAALEELLVSAAEDMGDNLEFAPLLSDESRDEDIAGGDERDDVEASDHAAITDKAQETKSSFAEPSVRTYDQELVGQAQQTVEYEGHLYARYDDPVQWIKAKEFCEKAGGHLATITSFREESVIQCLAEGAPLERYSVGGADQAWEGRWEWITGEDFEYTCWYSDQPDNSREYCEDGENILTVYRDGSWNDDNTETDQNGFILEIDSIETAATDRNVQLTDLNMVYSRRAEAIRDHQDPQGGMHFGSLQLNADESAYAVYDLKGDWTVFSGKISVDSSGERDDGFSLEIWGDNRLLYELWDYRSAEPVQTFSVDVTGVGRLMIRASIAGHESGNVYISEGQLAAPADHEPVTETVCSLEQVTCLGSSGYLLLDIGSREADCFGNTHSDWHRFDASESAEAAWYLNGAYQTFSASVICNENVRSTAEALNLEILLDGERALLIENDTIYQGPQEILLDVEGKRIMEIKTWANASDTRNSDLFLTDTGLMRAKEQNTDVSGDENVLLLPETIRDLATASAVYRDSVYYRFDQPMTLTQAKSFCKAQGGRIAFAKDEARCRVLETLMNNGGCESYWLTAYREQEKTDWKDGSFLNCENWNPEKPVRILDHAPGMKRVGEGKGNDEEIRGFILELVQEGTEHEQDTRYLSDLWMNDHSMEGVADSTGMTHYGSCVFDVNECEWMSGSLDGMYSRLVANLSFSDASGTQAKGNLAIFGDGRLLYELRHYKKDRGPVAIDVDLTGVNTLKIATDNDGTEDQGAICLNEAQLILAGTPAVSSSAGIESLIAVDETGISRDADLFTDAYEAFHDGYCCLKLNESVRGAYELNGNYHSFRGTVTAAADTAMDEPVQIVFGGDGQMLYKTDEFTKRGGMLSFEVDVTGVNVLEIGAEGSADGSVNTVYLTDLIFE